MAREELVRGLTANASADEVVVLEELRPRAWPAVGDRVAHQNDALLTLGRSAKCLVRFSVTLPVSEFVFLCLCAESDAEQSNGCDDSSFHDVFYFVVRAIIPF